MKAKKKHDYYNQYGDLKQREDRAIATINKHLTGFEYAGGFTHCDGYVNLKCKECGYILSRSLIGIRHNNGVRCPGCLENKRTKKQEDCKKKRMAIEGKRVVRGWDRANRGRQTVMKVCKECGMLFPAAHHSQVYCSSQCKHRVINRYKDNRINDTNLVDKDITLSKLYNRDGGRCYLCGQMCDWNNKVMDGNGNVIVGGNYPTIEHIQPLARGGLHAWRNVKLACKSCNELKRDIPLQNLEI